jgi:D-3-phosphoglycerate dehydrogenase
MKKILLATDKPFAKEAVQKIRNVVESSGNEFVLLEKYTSKEQLLDAVKNVHAIIIRSDIVDKEVIESASELKIVVRAGAGYDNIDLAAATAKGIVAMNTPGQNSNAVAELALGMMVFAARDFFSGKSGSELKGKTLGIHAYGNVGRNIARIAKGFGMQVNAFDAFVPKEVIEKDDVKAFDSAEELYEACQYISLNIPATADTKKSIDFQLLNKMQKGAVLINTARKEIINEADLVKLMNERADFVYLSDIEPDNKEEFAAKFQGRYFFTPKKSGAQTEEANVNAGIAAAVQIINFFERGDKTFQVNK